MLPGKANDTRLIIVSGPSGVGKSTLVNRLLEQCHPLELAVSTTTRPERKQDQSEYDHVTESRFTDLISDDQFLEWAKVHGEYYGTPRSEVERILSDGRVPILEIDAQGAAQVREKMEEVLSIFVEPPTLDELEERLRKRGTDGGKQMEIRLEAAREELERVSEYDLRIVNDSLPETVERMLQCVEDHVSQFD